MGLLDKIFDKKNCAICGGEIGLLGNRKLTDGNLCKDCARKLSPFMTDRRQSTVEEIRQHLAYREQNARVLLGVTPTRVFGHKNDKIYVDENRAVFFVGSGSNYIPDNPDVISISRVIGFMPTVREHREELYHHDREGRRVPYNPRRYRVEYSFEVEIQVNAPFFNQIKLELSSDRPDNPHSELYRRLEDEVMALQNALNPANYAAFAPTAMPGERPANSPAASRKPDDVLVSRRPDDVVATPHPKPATPAASASATSWTCSCGQVNGGNFCVNCGAKRPVVYRCDKCGWQPADPTQLPRFCPNCGDPFNESDVG